MNKTTNGLILRMKTAFFAGIAFGAGLLTTGLFAAAAAMNIFAAGEVISAAKINQNFQIAAPEGAVVAFFRTDCPEGWAPADGNNGTPDLRGLFIRGRDDVGTGAAGRDPGGARGVGGFQWDAFQGHNHQTDATWVAGWAGGDTMMTSAFGGLLRGGASVTTATNNGTHGDPRTANETRPQNVALTYCMRKN